MTNTEHSPTEQAEWVAQAQAGDADAFEKLYRANVGRVYAVCLRMTADRTLAEDLTQESFVRAWNKLGSFRGASAFSTWLHRLAVNVVLSDLRARRRHTDRITVTDDLTRFERPARDARPHARADLEKAIAGLPEGARNVFILHDVKGYQHNEIAEMLGLAAGTSKAQLHRARRLLREVLA